jgi:hypothetical protein
VSGNFPKVAFDGIGKRWMILVGVALKRLRKSDPRSDW